MQAPFKQISEQGALVQRALIRLQTGGDWALRLPTVVRQNLIWFFYDGFFSSASDNIIITYLVVYLLSLGATQAQIGLMSSLSSLTAAAMLIPGALLVERIGRRKEITVLGGGMGSRLMVLLMAALPFIFEGPALVTVAIALSVTKDMFGNLAYPAWMSLTGDLVPIEGRGRYFSSRNIAMAAIGITTTFLAGLFLSRMPQPAGYQGALFVAFLIGMVSTYSFSRIQDIYPQPARYPQVSKDGASQPSKVKSIFTGLSASLGDLRSHPEFLVYLAVTALWNFSLNIAGPFFNVYMVKNLHADAAMIGLTSIASTVATMVCQRKMGELNDRWGAHKLQMISGLLIPIVPVLWVFVTEPWHIIPLNLLSGALWGGFSLASFNYLLALTPTEQRARYSAIFQITVTLSMAVGAALGSLVVTQFGFFTIFVVSGAGRLIAALLFARYTKSEIPSASEPAAASS